MPENQNRRSQFWQELKRRKVVRVITVYAATSFAILELVSIIADPLKLPEWTLAFIFILLCVGFIIAVILSWVYDITPEGIEKTKSSKESSEKTPEKPSQIMAWRITTIISVFIIIGLVGFNIYNAKKQSKSLENLEKSFAVLPFDNMSPGEENNHLGDAFSDEIILELHKIQEFRILGRSSTMQYRDDRPTITEIADKLGVNYIIEGGIQRYQNDVSVRVQVIRAKNEDHIWGEEYNGKWADIHSIQDKIALNVARELKTVLSPVEIEKIEKRPTLNPEAYNLYLRGRFFWENRTVESLITAAEYFSMAIKLDSNYAQAYNGIADSYLMLAWYDDNITYLPKAKSSALKALELNENLAEVYATLGFIYYSEWNFDLAEEYYIKSLDLDHDYATAHHWYAILLCSKGLYNQAVDEILKAHDLDPLSLVINRNVGRMYIAARQYDNAIIALNGVKRIDPDFPHLDYNLARAYLNKGIYDSALIVIENSENLTWRGIIYARTGQMDKAIELYDQLVMIEKSDSTRASNLAIVNFTLGNKEEGFKYLEKAYLKHDLGLTEIMHYPEIRGIYSDPGFINFLRKIGLKD